MFDPSIYVVSSTELVPGRTHLDVARSAIRGGATAVQLRAPELPDEELLATARRFALLCNEDVAFVVNDRIGVAVEAGADGVHLGQSDEPSTARSRLGSELLLGISVVDAVQAREAETYGADYLGVTVWSTATKPDAVAAGLDRLREIADATALPVVGIGGIGARNAGEVIAAGAAGIAVISAVGAADDPTAATRELVEAVERARRAT